MRIVVNRMLCESNAVCVGIAPDVFEIDDDDELQILQNPSPASQLTFIEAVVRLCPKQALSIEEDQ